MSKDYTPNNFIANLSHYGILSIIGPDAAKFLQGQVTCDVNSISNEFTTLGSYCTPKGRMLTSFLLVQPSCEHYLLRMRRPLVEHTLSAFSKYIVFSKAKQTNANEDYSIIGIYGPDAKQRILEAFGKSPTDRYSSVINNSNIAIQLDDDGLMFECYVKQLELSDIWSILSSGIEVSDASSWELLTIRMGIGEVSAETTDMFIPQMLNYQHTGAVSFNKGCYTGQEIVARMQYRGKLKRAMYRIKTTQSEQLPGTEIYSTDSVSHKKQSVGNIVNSIAVNDHCEALAVITHKAVTDGKITIGEDDSAAEILTLPYTVMQDEE